MRRLLALILALLLVGCAASFEPPPPIAWTSEKWLAVEDASEMWRAYGAKVECDYVDDLHGQCRVREQSWVLGLAAAQPVVDGVRSDGFASYDRRRIWIWSLAVVRIVAAHELGHALMPIAGASDTEGHTATGVMRANKTPFEWTDEVLDLCRAEGACRE